MAQAAKQLRKTKDLAEAAAQEQREKEEEKLKKRNKSRDRRRKVWLAVSRDMEGDGVSHIRLSPPLPVFLSLSLSASIVRDWQGCSYTFIIPHLVWQPQLVCACVRAG